MKKLRKVNTFGDWFKDVRKDLLGMTQERLGMQLNCTQGHIIKFERDYVKMGGSVQYLFFDTIQRHLENNNQDWGAVPGRMEKWVEYLSDDYKKTRGWVSKDEAWAPPIIYDKELSIGFEEIPKTRKGRKNKSSAAAEANHEHYAASLWKRKSLKATEFAERLAAALEKHLDFQDTFLPKLDLAQNRVTAAEVAVIKMKAENNNLKRDNRTLKRTINHHIRELNSQELTIQLLKGEYPSKGRSRNRKSA